MIASISKGNSPIGLINYHENKIDNGCASVIGFNNLISADAACSTFKMLQEMNRNIKEPTFHVSLNLVPGESVSDDVFMNIANDYMEEMGYAEQPYTVIRHTDKEHEHIHIVSCRIGWDGKAISDSNNMYRSMKASAKIEKTYNLINVKHDVNKDKNEVYKVDIERISESKGLTKNHISTTTKRLLKSNNYISLDQYKRDLLKHNIAIETHKTISKGKEIEGLIYGITNEKGERLTKGIAASSMAHKPTKSWLENYFNENKVVKKSVKPSIKKKVNQVLKGKVFLTFKQFESALNRVGVEVKYDINSSGIYGVSFFDRKSKITFKGSEIGSSWNNLKLVLNDNYNINQGKETLWINTIYNKLRKEKLSESFFEHQFIEKNRDSLVEKINKMILDEGVRNHFKDEIASFAREKVSSCQQIKEREYKLFLEGFNINIASELGSDVFRSAALLNSFYIVKSKSGKGEKFHHNKSLEFVINNGQLNQYLNNRKYNYGNSLFLKHFKLDFATRGAVREAVISLKSGNYKQMPLEMFLDTGDSYAKNMLLELFGSKKDIGRIELLSTQSFIEKTFNRYSKKTKDLETLFLYLAANGIVVGKNQEDQYYLYHKENENILMHLGGEALKKWGKKLDKCRLEKVYEKLDPLLNSINKSDVRQVLSGNCELPKENVIKELGLDYAAQEVRKALQDKGEIKDWEKEFRKDKAEFEKEFKEGLGEQYGSSQMVGEERGIGSNPFEYFDSDESSYNSNERDLKRKKKKKKK